MKQTETILGLDFTGPMPVDDYIRLMTRAYYENNEIGHDFHTPPEFFPQLGNCYASLARNIYRALGKPRRFPVFEGGGGNGTFAYGFLSQAQQDPDFFQALDYTIIEQSQLLTSRQRQINQNYNNKIQWHNTDITNYSFSQLSEAMLIAIELDDDLPSKAMFKRRGEPKEIYLVQKQNKVVVDAELDASLEAIKFIHDYPEWWNLVPDLIKIPVPMPLNSVKLRQRFVNSVQRGIIITTDYGYELAKVAKYMHNWVFSQYKVFRNGHRLFFPDDDFFSDIAPYIGSANHTVEIDFTALSLPGLKAGYQTIIGGQYDFLQQNTPLRLIVEQQAKRLASQDKSTLKEYLKKLAYVVCDKEDWTTSVQWQGFDLPWQSSDKAPANDWFYHLADTYDLGDIRPETVKGPLR